MPKDTPEFEDESLILDIETFGKGNNVRAFTTGQGLQVEWDWVEDPVIRIPVIGEPFLAASRHEPAFEMPQERNPLWGRLCLSCTHSFYFQNTARKALQSWRM